MAIKIRYVFGPTKPQGIKLIELLNNLDKKIFPHDELENKYGSYWWIAYDDDKPVGFAGLRVISGYAALLCRAGVVQNYRGIGIHKRLIKAREKMAKKLQVPKIITYTSHENIKSSNSLIKAGYFRYQPTYEWGIKNAIYFCKEIK
jgi:GNAT superfamily N-acetyltransferase